MTERIEKARKQLAELEAKAEKLRIFLSIWEDLGGDEPVDNGSSKEASPGAQAHATPAQIVESAKLAIREKGSPLTRSQLVKALSDKGVVLGGKDLRKNLGTVLWRSHQFDNVSGKGYWPKAFGRWAGQRISQPELPGT